MISNILGIILFLVICGFTVGVMGMLQVLITTAFIRLGAFIHQIGKGKKEHWDAPEWLMVPRLFVYQLLVLSFIVLEGSSYFGWSLAHVISYYIFWISVVSVFLYAFCLMILAVIHGKFELDI